MKVNVLFFGNLSELVNANHLVMENVADTNELLNKLNSKFQSLKNYNYRIAINQNMEAGVTTLKNGDEIALLPPFSGG